MSNTDISQEKIEIKEPLVSMWSLPSLVTDYNGMDCVLCISQSIFSEWKLAPCIPPNICKQAQENKEGSQGPGW